MKVGSWTLNCDEEGQAWITSHTKRLGLKRCDKFSKKIIWAGNCAISSDILLWQSTFLKWIFNEYLVIVGKSVQISAYEVDGFMNNQNTNNS